MEDPVSFFLDQWGNQLGVGVVVVAFFFIIRELKGQIKAISDALADANRQIHALNERGHDTKIAMLDRDIKHLAETLREVKMMQIELLKKLE